MEQLRKMNKSCLNGFVIYMIIFFSFFLNDDNFIVLVLYKHKIKLNLIELNWPKLSFMFYVICLELWLIDTDADKWDPVAKLLNTITFNLHPA